MVFLTEAYNDIEADIICGLLKTRGIQYEKLHRGPYQGLGVIMGQEIGVTVMVLPEQLAEARLLLEKELPDGDADSDLNGYGNGDGDGDG